MKQHWDWVLEPYNFAWLRGLDSRCLRVVQTSIDQNLDPNILESISLLILTHVKISIDALQMDNMIENFLSTY